MRNDISILRVSGNLNKGRRILAVETLHREPDVSPVFGLRACDDQRVHLNSPQSMSIRANIKERRWSPPGFSSESLEGEASH